jgi:hypothetical protein
MRLRTRVRVNWTDDQTLSIEIDSRTQTVAIVRDRVQALVRKGATLDQVKAARPTADYDTRYGATSGAWTTDRSVEAVYVTVSRRP